MKHLQAIPHGLAIVAGMGWDRLLIAVAVIVAITVLTINGKIPGEATIAIFSALIAYVVGAGHEAAKGANGT